MKRCETCDHYNPLKSGEPPAGWCEFTANVPLPMWMEKYRTHIDSLGADIVATDGEDCDAYKGQ
jgi:hypothetical protein